MGRRRPQLRPANPANDDDGDRDHCGQDKDHELNTPLRELAEQLRRLPKDREIIAYCRGHYCVFAFEAVAMLRENGFRARRLQDGFPEWKAAGLPIA
jgi:rhodanese-related sulfurtransferase